MIQPLRRAHFAIWIIVPVILAVLFCAGLLLRRLTTPANANLHWDANSPPAAERPVVRGDKKR